MNLKPIYLVLLTIVAVAGLFYLWFYNPTDQTANKPEPAEVAFQNEEKPLPDPALLTEPVEEPEVNTVPASNFFNREEIQTETDAEVATKYGLTHYGTTTNDTPIFIDEVPTSEGWQFLYTIMNNSVTYNGQYKPVPSLYYVIENSNLSQTDVLARIKDEQENSQSNRETYYSYYADLDKKYDKTPVISMDLIDQTDLFSYPDRCLEYMGGCKELTILENDIGLQPGKYELDLSNTLSEIYLLSGGRLLLTNTFGDAGAYSISYFVLDTNTGKLSPTVSSLSLSGNFHKVFVNEAEEETIYYLLSSEYEEPEPGAVLSVIDQSESFGSLVSEKMLGDEPYQQFRVIFTDKSDPEADWIVVAELSSGLLEARKTYRYSPVTREAVPLTDLELY